jgi:ligand-binding SRPBCC domain-containing protein
MNFILRTQVNGYYTDVMKRFDLDLFEALKPIGAKMEVVQFTGSETGDVVEIKFISPIKASWISDITDHGADDNQAYFIDVGRVLPFPLKEWQHRHIVEKVDDHNSIIVDDITFSSGRKWLDVLIYVPLMLSFYPRKRIYRRYFGE